MFGEEDTINERNYTTTMRCLTANAIVYCIRAEEFFQRLGRDEKTWKLITQRIRDKDVQTKKKVKQLAI